MLEWQIHLLRFCLSESNAFVAFVPTSTMDSGGLEHDGAACKAHHLCSLVCACRVLKVHSGRGGARRWRMVCTFNVPIRLCAISVSVVQYSLDVGNKFVRLDFSVDTEIRIFNRSVLLAPSSRVTRVHKLQHQAPTRTFAQATSHRSSPVLRHASAVLDTGASRP